MGRGKIQGVPGVMSASPGVSLARLDVRMRREKVSVTVTESSAECVHGFVLGAITGDGVCLCKRVIFLVWAFRCHVCAGVAVPACQLIRSELSAVV